MQQLAFSFSSQMGNPFYLWFYKKVILSFKSHRHFAYVSSGILYYSVIPFLQNSHTH